MYGLVGVKYSTISQKLFPCYAVVCKGFSNGATSRRWWPPVKMEHKLLSACDPPVKASQQFQNYSKRKVGTKIKKSEAVTK